MSKNHPTAHSEMLIRKPVSDVFEAMVNPEITSEFWFTKGSDRLDTDRTVEWEWGQFGVQATITVTRVRRNELIRFQWPTGEGDSSYRTVEITFEPKSDVTTFVRAVESDFDKDDEHLINKVTGQTEGWVLVLCGLKAWLKHGINLNLIGDHKPNED